MQNSNEKRQLCFKQMVPSCTNSWNHVSSSCRHCLTSWLLNRPISGLFLLCVSLILVCRGSRERRRSGRCDERIDLDVMRGWGQSVSQSGRLARRQQIPFPCQSALSLSESDLTFTGWWLQRPGTRRRFLPKTRYTHTKICYSMKHAQWEKHSPLVHSHLY